MGNYVAFSMFSSVSSPQIVKQKQLIKNVLNLNINNKLQQFTVSLYLYYL